eukprot:7776744-Pyramimonas_sp.AAC.1
MSEIRSHYQQAGPRGGFSAVPVSFPDYQSVLPEDLPAPATFGSDNFEHIEKGRDDLAAVTELA